MMRTMSSFCIGLALLAGRGEEARAAKPEAIDIVFALDTTGSMSDEIRLVRSLVWDLANGLVQGSPPPSLRLALVRYRDKGDSYVAKVTPLTRDLDAVHKVLMRTNAGGGGDWPEHVSLALNRSVEQKWRKEARKIIFLIGDAPPSVRGDYDWKVEAKRAAKAKVAIHAIGCSGIGRGAATFRSIASIGSGSYTPLPRGRGSATSFRNAVFKQAGLTRYVRNATPIAPPPKPTTKVAVVKPKAPVSKDARDRRYAATPDRIWRSTVE